MMDFTAPQRRLLSEGELYGRYTKPGRGADPTGTPIDQLINLVQAQFIDWNLSDPKFKMMFHQSHPYASERYLEEMGGMAAVIDDELSDMSGHNQSPELIQMLIRKTKETKEKPSSSIIKVLIKDVLDLSVRAGFILNDMKIFYLDELLRTPKSEIMRHRNVGRVTMKELDRRISEYFDGHNKVIPDELEMAIQWVNQDYIGRPSGQQIWLPKTVR